MIDLTDTPLPRLPERDRFSHKGDYGRALIVGGSLGMAGAPALAGMACLRSGAGLVTVAVPRCVQATVACYCPAYTTVGLEDDGEQIAEDEADSLVDLCQVVKAVAVGPGLGPGPSHSRLTDMLWCVPTPMVIDADGLNALATLAALRRTGPVVSFNESTGVREEVYAGAPAGPRVLTPHAGEFARLDGESLVNPDDDVERRERAATLARTLGGEETIVLLKGPRTVVTDGERYAINATGNPGMATGGAGDVLTGVITALLAQGLSAFDAARLGAHVHGLAGDLAAEKLGEVSLTAPDLIDWLPAAWRQVGTSQAGTMSDE